MLFVRQKLGRKERYKKKHGGKNTHILKNGFLTQNQGFWVGAESSSSAPEIVSTANVEANAVVKEVKKIRFRLVLLSSLIWQWIEKPDSFSVRTSAIQMAKVN